MAKDPWHYPRTALADQYLKTLGIGLSKSLVLFAQRRMGKTEFLRKDLRRTGIMGAGDGKGQRPHAGSPAVDEHVGPEEKPHTAARGRNSDAGGREAVWRTGSRSEERPRQAWRPN